tara:strand:- start:8227 stop:8703 length:477 start_codon:yes stop_codon:yes gene_type:complete
MNKSFAALFIFIFVGFDQISKIWISSFLSLGESVNLLSFLNFTLIHNPGIAFSFFDQGGAISRWLLVFIVLLILIFLISFLFKNIPDHKLEFFSLLLIISGGLGNLIDRLFLGYVVDFIHVFYNEYSFYVFNLADSYISVGIAIYLGYLLFIERTRKT